MEAFWALLTLRYYFVCGVHFAARYAVCLGALGLHVLEIARVGGLQQFGGEGSETTSGLLEIRFMGVG